MIKVSEALLHMYEEHKKYLEKQVEMHMYLENKSTVANYHAGIAQGYANALDNIKSLFGETE